MHKKLINHNDLGLITQLGMYFAKVMMLWLMQVLMNIISTRGAQGQGACLDALISIMLDSSANQMVVHHFFLFNFLA